MVKLLVRPLALASLSVLVVGLLIFVGRQRADTALTRGDSFRRFVAFVEQNGRPAPHPSNLLRYFGLPAEGDWTPIRAVVSSPESARESKTFAVRRRGLETDVIVTANLPDAAYFYLVSESGQLRKSTVMGEQSGPDPIPDAPRRFAEERDFWIKWADTIQSREK